MYRTIKNASWNSARMTPIDRTIDRSTERTGTLDISVAVPGCSSVAQSAHGTRSSSVSLLVKGAVERRPTWGRCRCYWSRRHEAGARTSRCVPYGPRALAVPRKHPLFSKPPRLMFNPRVPGGKHDSPSAHTCSGRTERAAVQATRSRTCRFIGGNWIFSLNFVVTCANRIRANEKVEAFRPLARGLL